MSTVNTASLEVLPDNSSHQSTIEEEESSSEEDDEEEEEEEDYGSEGLRKLNGTQTA